MNKVTLPQPGETLIEGGWLSSGGKVVADPAAQRIEGLVRGHLRQIAVIADGWAVLFKDPADGRLWELTYPQSEMHGGGPPRLENISLTAARLRYNVVV